MGHALSVQEAIPVSSGSSANPSTNEAKMRPCCENATGDFPANLHGMRRCFPELWGSFLRAHFQSATHVAAFFDVDHHTARAWMNGKHGATAPVALYAIQRIPGALRELTGEAA